MNKNLSIIGVLVVLSVLSFSLSFAAIVPIDTTMKALNADGTPVNTGPYDVAGVVTNINASLDPSRFQYYIQDTGTGLGFLVDQAGGVPSNPTFAEGDLMTASGSLLNYYGIIEFSMTGTATKLGSGYGFATVVAYSGISSVNYFVQNAQSGAEFVEGRVYRLDNVTIVGGAAWPTSGTNANILISDFSGATITMRIDKDTLIPNNRTSAPTGSFTVIGWGVQNDSSSPYTSEYQIIPRAYTDIIDGTVVYPAPIISNSMYSPGIPTSSDSVKITATVTFDSTATPGPVQVITNAVGNATMYDDGAHGDGAAGDHVFGGYLPPGSDGMNVGWYINAVDNNHPSGVTDPGAAISGTVYYYPIRNNPTIEPIGTVRNAANATQHIVRGRVIAQPGNITSATDMYIQDTTGGIRIYSTKMRPGLVEGDQVTVMGSLATYSGEKELSLNPNASGNAINKDLVITVPAPVAKSITTNTLNTDSTIQGTLIKFTNAGYATGWSWDSVVSDNLTKIDDGSGAAVMYIYGATGITDPGSSRFDVVGVAVAFGSNTAPTAELKPRHQSDFTANVVIYPPNNMNLNPGDTVQFIASGGTGPYTWTCSNYAVGTVNSTGLFTAGPGLGTCHVTATDSGLKTGDSGTISVIATSAPIYIEPKSIIRVR